MPAPANREPIRWALAALLARGYLRLCTNGVHTTAHLGTNAPDTGLADSSLSSPIRVDVRGETERSLSRGQLVTQTAREEVER